MLQHRELSRTLASVGGLTERDLPRGWLARLKAQALALQTVRDGLPRNGLPAEVNDWREGNRENLLRGVLRLQLAKDLKLPYHLGVLGIRVYRGLGKLEPDHFLRRAVEAGQVADRALLRALGVERLDFGVASHRMVTTAGVNYLVDALQNLTEPENLKFHGMGTGGTAEAAGDTALQTEVETRATGSQAEGASANIYRTVGTITATATRAIVEHGILSASSAGTLLDRTVFSVINLAVSDSIQFTYELTIAASG